MVSRLLFLTALLLLAPHVSLAAPQSFPVYSNLDQSTKTFSQQLSVYHYQTRLLDLAVTDYDDGDYADALVKFNLLSRLNNAEA